MSRWFCGLVATVMLSAAPALAVVRNGVIPQNSGPNDIAAAYGAAWNDLSDFQCSVSNNTLTITGLAPSGCPGDKFLLTFFGSTGPGEARPFSIEVRCNRLLSVSADDGGTAEDGEDVVDFGQNVPAPAAQHVRSATPAMTALTGIDPDPVQDVTDRTAVFGNITVTGMNLNFLGHDIPTMPQWAMFVMILLVMTSGTIVLARGAQPVGAGVSGLPISHPSTLFVPDLYFRVLGLTSLVVVGGLSLAAWTTGSVTTTDLVGSTVCWPLAAYLIHLWIEQAGRSR